MKFDEEKLLKVTDVFFHASCPDGTAAAMIIAAAYANLERNVEFHPIQYGTDKHATLVPGPGQLFVDITPPLSRWEEWREYEPIVLDHHETAKHVTEGLGGVYATNDSHSGAMLAYEQVAIPLIGENDEWRRFAELAMIRDTWKKDHPSWVEAYAQAQALQLYGADLIEQIYDRTFRHTQFAQVGKLLLDRVDRSVKKIARSAARMTVQIGGRQLTLATFNCTEKIISDAADLLIEEGADVAAGYFFLFEEGAQRAVVSVRTNGSVSARKVAEFLGGGGHDRAAGFRVADGFDASPGSIAATLADAIRAVVGE